MLKDLKQPDIDVFFPQKSIMPGFRLKNQKSSVMTVDRLEKLRFVTVLLE